MPMQMIVAVLGPHRDGRRHCHFTKAMMHPRSHKIRFKKKSNTSTTEFKDTYQKIWREDHANISVHEWLEAMHSDGVLQESLFVVDVPVPGEVECQRLLDMAEKKMARLHRSEALNLPEPSLSACRWPNPCPFLNVCHGDKWKEPSRKAGFLEAESLVQEFHR
jgi:hypothetical protein